MLLKGERCWNSNVLLIKAAGADSRPHCCDTSLNPSLSTGSHLLAKGSALRCGHWVTTLFLLKNKNQPSHFKVVSEDTHCLCKDRAGRCLLGALPGPTGTLQQCPGPCPSPLTLLSLQTELHKAHKTRAVFCCMSRW